MNCPRSIVETSSATHFTLNSCPAKAIRRKDEAPVGKPRMQLRHLAGMLETAPCLAAILKDVS